MASLPDSDVIERLRAVCEAQMPDALSLLREMVAINSFTENRSGVNAVGRLTAQAFSSLGFTAEFIRSTRADYGDHLLLTRKGTGPATLAFITHLDTVFSPEEEARHKFRWRLDGDRIYGPGTLDIKGGTVLAHMILTALRSCVPDAFDQANWLILLNSSEEAPSADFGRLCRERIPSDALGALVLEGGGRAGTSHALVTARKGRGLFRVETHGRSAHAGNLHARGVNAIAQLAHTIQRIEALTDHDRGLTFNVGVVSGGTVVNRIPHHAMAEVEMRAFDPKVHADGVKAIHALQNDVVVRSLEDGHACDVEIQAVSEIVPWPRNAATEGLFRLWQETGRTLGMTVVRQERGGVSDGNHVWSHVPTLDGLGPCGDNAHSSVHSADGSKEQEYVEQSSFVPCALLNAAAILRLLGAAEINR